MYQTLKKIALSIVPKKNLFGNEIFFRSLFAFQLCGKIWECKVFGKGLKKFITIPDVDKLCPFCDSRSRTRRLYFYLIENSLLSGKVLHFSPLRVYRNLRKNQNITYFSTDFEDEFLADYRYNITQIPLENNFFDLTICYHILEHIENDQKAMEEFFRILKPSEKCMIKTFFKEGEIYEDPLKKMATERLAAFGQEDHVLICSVEGLQPRLKKSGFETMEIKTFQPNGRYSFMEETVVICTI